jgi:hypothetical protein
VSQQVPSTALEDAIHAWVADASGLGATKVRWEQQDGPRPAAPYVSLLLATVEPTGHDETRVAANPLAFADKVVTSFDAGSNAALVTAHALATGDGPVRLTNTGGAVPTGLATATDYWWIRVDATHGKFATSLYRANAGTAEDLTGAGTGTTKVVSTADTVTRGAEVTATARGLRRCRLVITCYSAAATGPTDAVGIVGDVVAKVRLPTRRAALRAAGIGLPTFGPVQALGGPLNSAHFEPRATCEATFFAPSEASEATTYVEFLGIGQQVEDQAGDALAEVALYVPSDPAA